MIECHVSQLENDKVQLNCVKHPDELTIEELASMKHLRGYFNENNTVESLRYFMMNTPDVFLWKWKESCPTN